MISGAPAPTGAENAFGLASVWNDDHYYSGLATSGAGAYADCIGVHYNEGIVSPTQSTGDPRDNYATRYFDTMLNRALAAFPNKKACFTEIGYLSPEGYGPLPTAFAWAANTTAAQQAQWLGQVVTRARNSGRVAMLNIFNVDFTTYGADPQARIRNPTPEKCVFGVYRPLRCNVLIFASRSGRIRTARCAAFAIRYSHRAGIIGIRIEE